MVNAQRMIVKITIVVYRVPCPVHPNLPVRSVLRTSHAYISSGPSSSCKLFNTESLHCKDLVVLMGISQLGAQCKSVYLDLEDVLYCFTAIAPRE